MAEAISAKVAWALSKAIKGVSKDKSNGRTVKSATVVKKDSDGTVWVRMAGSDIETPINGGIAANVDVGDSVLCRIDGTALSLTGNTTDPAVGMVRATGITERIVERAKGALEAGIGSAQSVADAAQRVANAVNQHFFADDNGIHVTQVTQEEWEDDQTGPNVLINSLGQLFRDGLTNLLSLLPAQTATDTFEGDGSTVTFTLSSTPTSMVSVSVNGTETTAYTISSDSILFDSAPSDGAVITVEYFTSETVIAIWDGFGNDAVNVLASFGKVIRIGRELAGNTEITSSGMRIKYATDRLYEVSADGERVTIYTGGSTAASGMDYTNAYVESLVTWLNDSCRVVEVGGEHKVVDGSNNDTQLIVSDWQSTSWGNSAIILDADGNTFTSGTYDGVLYDEYSNDGTKRFSLNQVLYPQSEVSTAPVHMEMGGVAIDLANKQIALSSEQLEFSGVIGCGGIVPKWVTIDPATFFESMSSGWANDTSYTLLSYSPTLHRVVGRMRINSTAAHSAGNNVIGTVASEYRPYIRALCDTTTTNAYKMYIDANGNATIALSSATTASTTGFYFVADYTIA